MGALHTIVKEDGLHHTAIYMGEFGRQLDVDVSGGIQIGIRAGGKGIAHTEKSYCRGRD
jgi:hypothetical protein